MANSVTIPAGAPMPDRKAVGAERQMLTARRVAEMLALSQRTVYDLADSGRLACHRFGVSDGAVRFSLDDVEAYRESCRVPARVPCNDGEATWRTSTARPIWGVAIGAPDAKALPSATKRRKARPHPGSRS